MLAAIVTMNEAVRFRLQLLEVADNNGVDSDGNEIHQSVGECTQVLQDVAAGLALLRRKSVAVPTCGHGEDVLSEAEEFSRDDYVSSAHLDISTHMYG
ncbi:UNVERIFIED_CONTAM: hypothetical protein Scaly_0754700 [Sesamum calycinum]|uniref:Uncharacterized protein n=1 Tax=Sesamum calycinum TaxID=2727403 RepID=A0AAW2R8J5_9LAMI